MALRSEATDRQTLDFARRLWYIEKNPGKAPRRDGGRAVGRSAQNGGRRVRLSGRCCPEGGVKAMQLESGRPKDAAGRLAREMRVYDLLDGLKIGYERVDHDAVETMAACKEIDALLSPAAVCKNLLLCDAHGRNFYLLMLRGDKRLDCKQIAAQIGRPRLSFAPAQKLEEFLGLGVGAVSVLGLMNDRGGNVQLLVDADLLREEAIGCHPCVNTSSLRIGTRDLLEVFLPAVGHAYRTVTCSLGDRP